MSTILVTGGAGFIGSHVVDRLIAKQHRVIVLDDLSGGFIENVNPEAVFVEGQAQNAALVSDMFGRYRFDYVFHLAAYAAEGLSHFIKRFNYENNLTASVTLINAAVNAGTTQCFVFTSSIAVYGPNQLPMHEELVPLPEDSYGIAKYAVEQELRASARMFGLPYVIFRPHNVYGPRQNLGDRYRNVVGIFMNQIMSGQPMSIFGDGSQSRAFTYIDDVAPVIAAAVDRPDLYGEVFNVGGDVACTVLELAHLVAKSMGVEPVIEHLAPRSEVPHAYATHAKVRRFLDDVDRIVSLEDGLAKMACWARSLGPRTCRPFAGIEISKKFPEAWAD